MKKMYLMYKDDRISRHDMIKEIALFNHQLIDDDAQENEYVITNKEDTNNYMSEVIDDKSLVNEYKSLKLNKLATVNV